MDIDLLLPFHKLDKYFDEAISSLELVKRISINVILIDDRVDKSKSLSHIKNRLKNYQIVETRGGIGYGLALEIGSKYIQSNAVALFNSDDLVHPDRFFKQLDELESSELNFTKLQRFKGRFKSSSLIGEMNAKFYSPMYLLLGSYGANASWCMRSEWWRRNAFFDNENCLDWRIALSSFKDSKVSYLDEALYFYRKHNDQVTSNKYLSRKQLQPLYESWNYFAISFGMPSSSFENFSTLALPWNSSEKIDIQDLKFTVKEVLNSVKSENPNLYADFLRLIQRRYILAIRQHYSYMQKIHLALNGSPQILNLSKDIIYQLPMKPFR